MFASPLFVRAPRDLERAGTPRFLNLEGSGVAFGAPEKGVALCFAGGEGRAWLGEGMVTEGRGAREVGGPLGTTSVKSRSIVSGGREGGGGSRPEVTSSRVSAES